MIVVLQIVTAFYCRKSYRLLKGHQESTLSAISRRDVNTWTLIVIGIAFHCQNSRNIQRTIAILTANNKWWPVFTLLIWCRCDVNLISFLWCVLAAYKTDWSYNQNAWSRSRSEMDRDTSTMLPDWSRYDHSACAWREFASPATPIGSRTSIWINLDSLDPVFTCRVESGHFACFSRRRSESDMTWNWSRFVGVV
jgi:hypothetical protein